MRFAQLKCTPVVRFALPGNNKLADWFPATINFVIIQRWKSGSVGSADRRLELEAGGHLQSSRGIVSHGSAKIDGIHVADVGHIIHMVKNVKRI
jgi:hypothetical protein